MLAERLFKVQCWDEDEDGPTPDIAAESEMIALLRERDALFEKIGWDNYDGSLELYGVPNTWRMSADIQKVCWDEGFIKVYVNHLNKWETHYSFGTPDGFKVAHGWRVSYPHKRAEDGRGLLLEETPSWPRTWWQKLLGIQRFGATIVPPDQQ